MKIDFKKLKKVEQEYHYNSPVCENTLQTLIDVFLSNNGADSTGVNTSHSYLLALKTLGELGILVEDNKTALPPQHLNS